MSLGPLGMIGSAAGTPLSQRKGADVEKTTQETTSQTRQNNSAQQAENAAGIGQTEHDEQASDRDADGRRVWEIGAEQENADDENGQQPSSQQPPKSRDAHGESGNQLDLSG